MGVGDGEYLEDTLERPIFAGAAVQHVEGNVGSKRLQQRGDVAPDIDAFSSCSARGTRIAQPLSRKWRLISPTTLGVA